MATLSGCIWPMDTVPVIPLQFQGQVLSPARAPVPGAEVQVWVEPLERAEVSAPFAAGRTDADGRFTLAGKVRNRVPPPVLTLRVIPPAASGLATKTLSGLYSEVFPDYSELASGASRYRTEVVLAPAP
jgi:hypothetical protein